MTKLVALAVPGGPVFVDQLGRIWDEGNAVLPLDPRLPSAAVEALLEDLGVQEVVDADGSRHSRPHAPSVRPGDAIVIATSGTTGKPKGVIHTHASVRASAEMTSSALGVRPDDHWLACLPLSHIGGLSVVTRAVLTDTALTVLPAFDAQVVEQIGRADATLVSLVNTALRRIDTTLFRRILLGGAAPLAERPANAVVTYGMTETGSGIVYDGKPLNGVSVKVDDDGQLLVKSPTLLRAYTTGNDPKFSGGWFPTGDAGSVDHHGVVTVHGRMSDVIISGGEKIWPAVVEQVLKTLPSIKEALVCGVPDAEWDERVVAQVELQPGAEPPSLDAVREHVRMHLASYYAPRELRIVEALDRTASGKVRRPARDPETR